MKARTDEGKCSCCGFKAPIICFMDAAQDSQMVQLYIQLPYELQKPFMRYLALFRPASGCAMQQSKVERLTRDFLGLVSKGFVSEKGKVDRPCPPSVWALGMERMQEQAASLTLPMKNHNYLRTIVWQLADQADARQEQHQRRAEIDGSQRVIRPPTDPDGMSEIMRKLLTKQGGHHDAE